MCPFPTCIHFADHEGEHEFAKDEPSDAEISDALDSLASDIRITEIPPDEPPDLEAAGD